METRHWPYFLSGNITIVRDIYGGREQRPTENNDYRLERDRGGKEREGEKERERGGGGGRKREGGEGVRKRGQGPENDYRLK